MKIMQPYPVEERRRISLNHDTRGVLVESLQLAKAITEATLADISTSGERADKRERERLQNLIVRQEELIEHFRNNDEIPVIK